MGRRPLHSGSSGSSSSQRREFEYDELIGVARRGSAEALDRLVERLSAELWKDLASRRRNKPGAAHGSSDLVQDTLLRVRQQFGKFERDTFADFKQWARSVLFRRRLEWVRNHQARSDERHKQMIWSVLRSRREMASLEAGHEIEADQRDEAERVFALFREFKVNEQFIIELRLFQELSYEQIASMTGLTKDAARKAYDRAIDKLRLKVRANE